MLEKVTFLSKEYISTDFLLKLIDILKHERKQKYKTKEHENQQKFMYHSDYLHFFVPTVDLFYKMNAMNHHFLDNPTNRQVFVAGYFK